MKVENLYYIQITQTGSRRFITLRSYIEPNIETYFSLFLRFKNSVEAVFAVSQVIVIVSVGTIINNHVWNKEKLYIQVNNHPI